MTKNIAWLLALALTSLLLIGTSATANAAKQSDSAHATHLVSRADAAQQVQPRRESRAHRWHRLNGKCRGGPGDQASTRRACKKRDDLTRQVGKEFVGRFHTAWKRNNRAALRRMVQPSARSFVMPMLRGRASQTARDCDYGTGAHYCYFRKTSGAWTGVQFKVVRIAPRRLPIWKVTGAAPDGV